jgi:hypothetical protein
LQILISLADSEEELVLILNCLKFPDQILTLCFDKIGNNVIQKIISCLPENKRELINFVIIQNFTKLVLHSNGMCVVKKFISENKNPVINQKIVEIVSANFLDICKNEFGNFVIQFVLETWGVAFFLEKFQKPIHKNIIKLSTNRCSSHVIEKFIELLDYEQRKKFIINTVVNNNKLYQLLDCKYGMFIIKKMMSFIEDGEKNFLKNLMVSKILKSSKNDKIATSCEGGDDIYLCNNSLNNERMYKLNYVL